MKKTTIRKRTRMERRKKEGARKTTRKMVGPNKQQIDKYHLLTPIKINPKFSITKSIMDFLISTVANLLFGSKYLL